MRRALMYLISEKLAQMRKANIAKISLLIFIIEPSIWRLRNGREKILQTGRHVVLTDLFL